MTSAPSIPVPLHRLLPATEAVPLHHVMLTMLRMIAPLHTDTDRPAVDNLDPHGNGLFLFHGSQVILAEDLPELLLGPSLPVHGQALAVLVQQLHGLGRSVRRLRSFPMTARTKIHDQVILLRQVPIRSAENMMALQIPGSAT